MFNKTETVGVFEVNGVSTDKDFVQLVGMAEKPEGFVYARFNDGVELAVIKDSKNPGAFKTRAKRGKSAARKVGTVEDLSASLAQIDARAQAARKALLSKVFEDIKNLETQADAKRAEYARLELEIKANELMENVA